MAEAIHKARPLQRAGFGSAGNRMAPRPDCPAQADLRPRCILASIAHAVWVARAPDFAHEQSWDGNNYSVQDSAGSRGTIAFSGKQMVAVFFSESSDRNPFSGAPRSESQRLLNGLPPTLESLAHEAQQYLLQTYGGADVPVITAAFWGDGAQRRVAAAETWSEVYVHGGFLIANQLLPEEESLAAWAEDYEFSPAEADLVRTLCRRRLAQPDGPLTLTPDERARIHSLADSPDGLEACRESLLELGMML